MITSEQYKKLAEANKIPKLSLDFYSDNYHCIPSKQMDHARYLEISLTEYGLFRPVRENETARLRLLKPDNTYIFNDCELIEGGKVLAALSNNILACAGKAKFDIVISNISSKKEDTYLYSTKIGFLDIAATPYPNDAIESTDEFDALTNMIVEEGKRIEALKALDETLTANESLRQANEANREAAELKRQEDTYAAIENVEAATAEAIARTEAATNEAIAKTEAATNEAIAKTEAATNEAIARTEAATAEAVAKADAAAVTALEAADNAVSAAEEAQTATADTRAATSTAIEAASAADEATARAEAATADTRAAISDAEAATEAANAATAYVDSVMEHYHFTLLTDTEPAQLPIDGEWLVKY